tara:strand:- start:4264 stop:5151 length:888 start_codon:yes stop_codon:yes gene_type:complete
MFVHEMKFGKLPSIDHLTVEFFHLPATHWHGARSNKVAEVFAGGTTWNISKWVGNTYPVKTPRRLYPEAYGKQFGTIEFNATHYRIYSPEKMHEWAQATPEGFQFCCKFPQIITHFRRFKNCEGPTDDFIAGLLALGNRMGPSFIQLPPHFAPKHSDGFWDYLEMWPKELPVSVEFRHPDWFIEGMLNQTAERLASLGVGMVISDTADRRDAIHMCVTAPHVLVRFGGYEGHEIDGHRMQSWAQWMGSKASKGVEKFHFLVHEADSLHTPKTCALFSQFVRQESRLMCHSPEAFG